MKKIIIPTGYMGSGSSAITDLLREYPKINTKNADFEFIFLHAPNGLFDLEDKLLNNNNAIRSDEALKTFENFMQSLYEYRGWWPAGYKQTVSNDIDIIVDNYIKSLISSEFTGTWYHYEKPSTARWLLNATKRRFALLQGKKYKRELPKQQNLKMSLLTNEEFYEKSNEFINNIIDSFAKNDSYVVMDQLLLPFNLKKIENYKIDNLYPIIVNRDPRDIFIANKYYWFPDHCQVPYPLEAKEFCDYYRRIRKYEKEQESNIRSLRINFEDLILNYEATVKKVEEYIEISPEKHKDKQVFLNPNISINNIQIYNRNEKYKQEVSIIEEELSEYLYPFKETIISDGEIF